MRSSSGEYFIALDHVRALAIFMVFTWHFTHGNGKMGPYGFPVPLDFIPAVFPLTLLDQGYTGVSLFMALSGYLFAKLLDGKTINYWAFIWNRIVRLIPLLIVVILIDGLRSYFVGEDLRAYALNIGKGIIFPTLPMGWWSITIEFHYYILLPIFLWLLRKSKFLPILLIVVAAAFRLFFFLRTGETQSIAYWTIVGRVDQFALGMMIFQFRSFFVRRHLFVGLVIAAFSLFYCWFDRQGGLFHNPSYPSTNPLWIFLLTIEGLVYAVAIAWYDNSFSFSAVGISGFIARIGTYAYSLYLIHCFFVFDAAMYVHNHIMNISNFYIACLWSLVCFLLLVPLGYLSFRFIEAPFLKLRRRYVNAAY